MIDLRTSPEARVVLARFEWNQLRVYRGLRQRAKMQQALVRIGAIARMPGSEPMSLRHLLVASGGVE